MASSSSPPASISRRFMSTADSESYYIYTHIYIYTYIHTHTHIYIYIYIYGSLSLRVCGETLRDVRRLRLGAFDHFVRRV